MAHYKKSKAARQRNPPTDPRHHGARCDECPLRGSMPVYDDGPSHPKLAIVGEAPGRDELAEGVPFIGRSGQYLSDLIRARGLERRDVLLANAVLCVEGQTSIRLADGTSKRIAQLVREKNPGPVLSILPDGTIGARPITGWFASRRAGRRLFKVTSARAKRNSNGMVGPTVTEDHLVLTSEGWVEAQHLEGKMMATGAPAPRGAATEAFDGAMLGDGSIAHGRRIFTTSHTVTNEDYVQALAHLWGGFGPVLGWIQPQESTHKGKIIRTNQQRTLRLAAGPWFGEQRERWYPHGVKIVPRDLKLTPMLLAVWFMDDGNTSFREAEGIRHKPRSSLAVCGFTRADVEWLKVQLNNLGLQCTATFARWPRINFSTTGVERLHALIAPYVVPSMQYKLVPYYRGKYRAEVFNRVEPGTYFDQASITEVPAAKVQTVFCLAVEGTHNFISTNGVLHNCFPPGGDMKQYLQRMKKEHTSREKETKANEKLAGRSYAAAEFHSPIDCCRPRLMFSLGVARCAGCLKWDIAAGPYEDASALGAISCTCPKPKWVKPPFGKPKAVLAAGNAALESLRASGGITKKQMYVFENKERAR